MRRPLPQSLRPAAQHNSPVRHALGTALACALCLASPARARAEVVFVGDFEKEGIVSLHSKAEGPRSKLWRNSGNAPAVVESENGVTPRAGKYMMKTYLNRKESKVSYRTEVVPQQHHSVRIGNEYWYALSIFLPKDYEPDKIWEIVAQWHGRPDKDLGEDWRNPVMALSTTHGEWTVGNRWDSKPNTFESGQKVYEGHVSWNLGRYQKGKWTDWVFHVKWSYEKDGLLEVWQDGLKRVVRNGPNCFNDKKDGPYFKMGLYKGWRNREKPEGNVGKRTLYHDEFRFAEAPCTYEKIAPPGPPQLPTWPMPPSNARATPKGPDTILVQWQDNSDNEESFKINRRQSGTREWVQLKELHADSTAYTDTGLPPKTKFYYKIKAGHDKNGDSPYSTRAYARTPPQNPPK